ncbi:unnamed protein product [Staurois parvus]|uniref:Uncharacterized protein n=1 Tax=Staurois parvus TaxID=386267 RepID=A0ABN9AMX9_9NEOB|nr:unnamed protein product [Staurois parvus]
MFNHQHLFQHGVWCQPKMNVKVPEASQCSAKMQWSRFKFCPQMKKKGQL